jgi:hypothetical protein
MDKSFRPGKDTRAISDHVVASKFDVSPGATVATSGRVLTKGFEQMAKDDGHTYGKLTPQEHQLVLRGLVYLKNCLLDETLAFGYAKVKGGSSEQFAAGYMQLLGSAAKKLEELKVVEGLLDRLQKLAPLVPEAPVPVPKLKDE